ncbi:TetR family transcriptional regulator [Streptomyces phaeochromogenes]|uniref:TetR family transcriptional regulator n=1 Tax=Streptomyces phaeochromogenes TaxID=1923 RepID=A0ABZ1H9W3_STRPH|nr:TetR family transcriptional regulator [Streptomyces phaeochromogenes]MCX5601336.1 TetR family transcriptional regulator [Streptomyces phaeochromogenes]WRZ29244.1 TetR family transcriptional regulator [Streptomyces phaeochromogenes]WSD14960.1 TetR family transcriptional regulator [Streptomyces phaeochromogenes]WSS93502.1 TetR family transcriptional regulator [Streptomyces phaeochromogenes]WSW17622.1 TetR family transcriptional regulator [Streptomyces phaeochromogenes]
MSHTLGIRQAQKQKTRQAFLDAALSLLEEQSLSSLGLREVTRAVGVAPTAFYRHFHSTADLGVALVEEALGSLHPMIAGTVSAAGDSDERIDRAVALIARHVREHPAHIRFIARERNGGVQKVRSAIAEQMARFADEVKAELAKQPESAGWSDDDLLMLAGLYVDQMLMTASTFLEAAPEEQDQVARVATRRMRLISIGRRHWLG